jgi:hypothetical protein
VTRFGIALIALLASCSQPAQAPNEAAANDSAVSVANVAAPVNNAETPGAEPAAPEPAPIPVRFRGTWAESKAACVDLKHHSRITISGRTVRHPDFVMVGDSVTASETQFALKGHFEGTDRPAEAQYFINEPGDVLTDGGGGGAVRVRCA